MKIFYIIGITLILSACAYYPKQIEVYDSECKINHKKLVLGKDKTNMRVGNCENEGCIANLLTIPVQALVAGSVIIVGNIIYWLEKEGTCLLKEKS